jgi:hypothetical protein
LREIELARKLLRESRGLDRAKKKSKEYAESAKCLINQTSLSEEVKTFFNNFITYIQKSLDWYK